jgi:hypothetical protein
VEHDEEFSQLPENTLTRNLGLDLIVVVTKVIIVAKLVVQMLLLFATLILKKLF